MQGHSRAVGGSPGTANSIQSDDRDSIIPRRLFSRLEFGTENDGPRGGHPEVAQAAAHRTAVAFINLVGEIPRMNVARQAELAQRQERVAAYRAAVAGRPVVPGG
jgi:hypothetical protein